MNAIDQQREQFLMEMLADLQRKYQAEAGPIVAELLEIKARQAPVIPLLCATCGKPINGLFERCKCNG